MLSASAYVPNSLSISSGIVEESLKMEVCSGVLSDSSSMAIKDRGKGKSELQNKIYTSDEMTEIINLQKSNGAVEITENNWTGSVLEKYLGGYTEVKFSCPQRMDMNLWITALSMKILEIKMGNRKDLWNLVVQKSEKDLRFLKEQLKKEKRNYKELIDLAEKYVMSK